MTVGYVREGDRGASGQFRLRMDPDLHAALTRRAETEGVSLNTLITGILARAAKRKP